MPIMGRNNIKIGRVYAHGYVAQMCYFYVGNRDVPISPLENSISNSYASS